MLAILTWPKLVLHLLSNSLMQEPMLAILIWPKLVLRLLSNSLLLQEQRGSNGNGGTNNSSNGMVRINSRHVCSLNVQPLQQAFIHSKGHVFMAHSKGHVFMAHSKGHLFSPKVQLAKCHFVSLKLVGNKLHHHGNKLCLQPSKLKLQESSHVHQAL